MYRGNSIFYRGILVTLLILLLSFSAKAQFGSIGGDPASLKWRYIKSENFKVIYPKGVDSLAMRYSLLLESLRTPAYRYTSPKVKILDVVLHPYSAISNGMVGWMPKRMELMTMAPANDNYTFNWDKHLITHELRHVAQIAQFREGIFKPLRWFIGEQSEVFGFGLFMNRWSAEGDAVVGETELGVGGRGRDPSHLLHYRASFLEEGDRSYESWSLGSNNEYTPNHYSFGYLFNSYIRNSSGNYYYLEEINRYAIDHFYIPFAHRVGYRVVTGLNRRRHFANLKEYYREKWLKEESIRAPFTPSTPLLPPAKRRAEFKLHQNPIAKGDTLFYNESSLRDIGALYQDSGNGNRKFIKYSSMINSPLKLGGGRLYWSEYTPSPRWSMLIHSDLFYWDIDNQRVKQATKGEYLFNPTPSQSGDSLLVVRYRVEGGSSIEIMNSNFELLDSFDAPKGYRVKESVVVGDAVIALTASDVALQLFKINFKERVWQEIAQFDGGALSKLNYNLEDNSLYFLADFEGVRALYSLQLNTLQLSQVVMPRFGLHSYFNSSNGVIVSDYSTKGYTLKEVNKESLSTKQLPLDLAQKGELYSDPIVTRMAAQANFISDTVAVSSSPKLTSYPYLKGRNLFKFHSWAPLYYNIDNIERMSFQSIYDIATLGFILHSQNSLGTAYTSIGNSWREGFGALHLNFVYSGLLPVIEFKASLNERNPISHHISYPLPNLQLEWSAPYEGKSLFRGETKLYIPLQYSRGGWFYGAIPSVKWRFSNDTYYVSERGFYITYQQFYSGVTLYKVLKMSQKDLFPKWGGGVSLNYSMAPFSGDNFGSLLDFNSYLYLPGVLKNHGAMLSFYYQHQFSEGKNYLLQGNNILPHGYRDRFSFGGVGGGVKYALSLSDRTFTIRHLLHLKRVQLHPFYNYLYNIKNQFGDKELLWSAGGDLIFDTHWLGLSYMLQVGVRGSVNRENRATFDLLLNLPL